MADKREREIAVPRLLGELVPDFKCGAVLLESVKMDVLLTSL
jgi:hypothetical protein